VGAAPVYDVSRIGAVPVFSKFSAYTVVGAWGAPGVPGTAEAGVVPTIAGATTASATTRRVDVIDPIVRRGVDRRRFARPARR
jgi:hypothetical protein